MLAFLGEAPEPSLFGLGCPDQQIELPELLLKFAEFAFPRKQTRFRLHRADGDHAAGFEKFTRSGDETQLWCGFRPEVGGAEIGCQDDVAEKLLG